MILLAGSLIVMTIGISLLRAKPDEIGKTAQPLSIGRTISSACVVTWFNPQAVIDGTMMLGAFHAALPPRESLTFISGTVSASCLWFFSLTFLISIFRERFHVGILRRINQVCGFVIVFYGGKLLWEFVKLF